MRAIERGSGRHLGEAGCRGSRERERERRQWQSCGRRAAERPRPAARGANGTPGEATSAGGRIEKKKKALRKQPPLLCKYALVFVMFYLECRVFTLCVSFLAHDDVDETGVVDVYKYLHSSAGFG